MSKHHLAQINIGRILAPLDSDVMAGFVARLDEINALADGSPGFVWRLQTEAGNATDLRPYDNDDTILLNMSVWESVAHLTAYVYRTAHAEVLKQRKQWFANFGKPIIALGGYPATHTRPVAGTVSRQARFPERGPSPYALDFRNVFEAPGV